MSKKEKTQEIFFHIFNEIQLKRGVVVLTSDKSVNDLNGLHGRLKTRFKSGITDKLTEPDYETRMAIVNSKLSQQDIDIDMEVIEYISEQIKSDMRSLRGVIMSLIAQSTLNRRHIDINLAKEVVGKVVEDVTSEISIEGIIKAVSEHYELSFEMIQSRNRKRNIMVPRQVCMYLAKQLTDKSLKAIGMHLMEETILQ